MPDLADRPDDRLSWQNPDPIRAAQVLRELPLNDEQFAAATSDPEKPKMVRAGLSDLYNAFICFIDRWARPLEHLKRSLPVLFKASSLGDCAVETESDSWPRVVYIRHFLQIPLGHFGLELCCDCSANSLKLSDEHTAVPLRGCLLGDLGIPKAAAKLGKLILLALPLKKFVFPQELARARRQQS